MNNLVLIFPTIALFLCFYGAKISPKTEFNENLWDKSQADILKGLAAIFVVIHHVSQSVGIYDDSSISPMSYICNKGFLITAIFFFFSGYGLMVSLKTKEDYIYSFGEKRLPSVIIPFWTANIAYAITYIFLFGYTIQKGMLLKYIFGIRLINSNSWYMVEIIILYLIFYILFYNLDSKKLACALMCVFTVLMVVYSYGKGHDVNGNNSRWFMGEWWFNSTIVYALGLLVGSFKDKVVAWAKKCYLPLCALAFVLMIVFSRLEKIVRNVYGYYRMDGKLLGMDGKFVTYMVQTICCILFVFLVLLINMKVKLNSKIMRYVGNISLELYLIHALFVNKVDTIRNINIPLKFLFVFCLSIPGAIVLHYINKFILYLYSQMLALKRRADAKRKKKIKPVKSSRDRILRCVVVFCALCITALVGYVFLKFIYLPQESKKEIKNISEAQVGDEVKLGRYTSGNADIFDARVCWIVVKKEGDKALLITKQGIESGVYNKTHNEVSWEDSHIRKQINDEIYPKLFSDSEKKYIVQNPETGDELSLLSVDEAREIYSEDVDRQITITEYAKAKGANQNTASKADKWDMKGYRSSWWWLRGDGGVESIYAPIVTVNGEISTDEKYVNKPNGVIRPAVWVEIK